MTSTLVLMAQKAIVTQSPMWFFCWISSASALEAKAEDACFMCQYKVAASVVSLRGFGWMLRLV